MNWPTLLLILLAQTGQDPDRPVPLAETVVVTATGTEEAVADSTSFSSVLQRSDLVENAGLTLDQHLSRIPGFALFRRSSSLTAHPTIQGVSLRGIGPSGAGRSLVLFDGIPLNDPFGGWIYWNRFPFSALQQVEIVRGSTSPLYGSGSLGGTIQLIPRESSPPLEFRLAGGNAEVVDVEALASHRSDATELLLAARVFATAGVWVISDQLRGEVDRPAGVDFQSFFGRLQRGGAHFGFNYYHEERNNGTELQTNRSRLALLEAGLDRPDQRFRFYFQSGRLESRFSRILPDRSQEFLTAEQDFPSIGLGASAVWDLTTQTTVGADWRFASWDGNGQHMAGLFLQHVVPLSPRLDWLFGVRGDMWQNRATRPSLNPRTALVYRVSPRLRLRSSLYRGFRAPTLNELYRPFRVGNVVTLANSDLRQERLWGVEGGVDLYPAHWALVRLNLFRNSLLNPVSNVTLSVGDNQILRQRQNGEAIDAAGFEGELFLERSFWQLRAAYLFTNSHFRESGLQTPQVPRHQGILELGYGGPVTLRAGARWVARQFEDDLNSLPLGGFVLFDLSLRKPLGEDLELFLSVENLLDRQYAVGRTPLERLGESRLVQAGIGWRWSR